MQRLCRLVMLVPLTSKISPCATCSLISITVLIYLRTSQIVSQDIPCITEWEPRRRSGTHNNILILLRPLRNYRAFQPIWQRKPDEISTHDITVSLWYSNAQWYEELVDGCDHMPVPFSVAGLKDVIDILLQLTMI